MSNEESFDLKSLLRTIRIHYRNVTELQKSLRVGLNYFALKRQYFHNRMVIDLRKYEQQLTSA